MQRIGRYELGRVLGEGGAGRVFAAVLQGPGGLRLPVALKVLHEGGEALQREARIGGLLRHRHLVDVYEVGESDGRWFCAMERCAASLTELLPLPPRAVVEVGLAVCEALIYARDELGLVHLDIKPDNLLLSPDGVVKLSDLGIARADGFATDGTIRGTLGFMPPEQRTGGAVDSRADVYALAVTLLTLGEGPRAAATMDWLAEAPPGEDFPIPTAEGDSGMDALVAALEPCLSPDRSERLGLEQMAERLGAIRVDGRSLEQHVSGQLQDGLETAPWWEPEAARLIGRDVDLQSVFDRLEEPGIQVLTGPAGVGKSTLAEAVVGRWREQPRARALFVDLGTVRSEAGLIGALGRVLRAPLADAADPAERLGRVLAGRGPILVVLDTFEHLTECVGRIADWRAAAPQVRWLLTSRVALEVGEQVPVGLLDEVASVALLERRARERGVDVGGHPSLPELARRLDGLPLALELAAGRLGVLGVDEVVERLGLGLLRAAESGRHGTLRAALMWSWDLLGVGQQRMLAQLSVFDGGFSVEAVEEVVEHDGDRLADLEALLRASMVATASEGRFRLLDSVRAFAAEVLDDEEVEARHARYFARFGAGEHLDRMQRAEGIQALENQALELDNLVVAARRSAARGEGELAALCGLGACVVLELTAPAASCVALLDEVAGRAEDPETRLRVATALGHSLGRVGAYDRACDVLEQALATGEGPTRVRGLATFERAKILGDRGIGGDQSTAYEAALELALSCEDPVLLADIHAALGRHRGNLGSMALAEQHFDEARALANILEGHRAEGPIWRALGRASWLGGRRDHAFVCCERALASARRWGDRRLESSALGSLSNLVHDDGNHDEAIRLAWEAIEGAVHIGDPAAEGRLRANLGMVLVELGRVEEALEQHELALQLHRSVGHRASEGYVLAALGAAHFQLGNHDRVEHYLQLAMVAHTEVGNLGSRSHVLATLGLLRASTGLPEEGRVMLEQALDIARELGRTFTEGLALGYLGFALKELGRLEEARDSLHESIRVLDSGHRFDVARGRCWLAEVEVGLGNLAEAQRCLALAKTSVGERNDGAELTDRLAIAEAVVATALGEA